MRRLFIIGGMALWLVSCANSGNGVEDSDTSAGAGTTMEPTSDPRDTVNVGLGAGVDEQTNAGPGTVTGTGTGAAGAGGSATGANAGTGGAGTTGDTSRRNNQ
jgi:hypothetical protein